MKKLRINYLKNWDSEGYCYKQTIYIDKTIKDLFNEKIKDAPKTFDNNLYLKELTNDKVQYLKLTQAKYLLMLLVELNYDTKRFLLDRNTRIVIL